MLDSSKSKEVQPLLGDPRRCSERCSVTLACDEKLRALRLDYVERDEDLENEEEDAPEAEEASKKRAISRGPA